MAYLCERDERGNVVCGGLDDDESRCKEGSKVCVGGAEFTLERIEFVERTSSQTERDRGVSTSVVKEEVDGLVCDSPSGEACCSKDCDRRLHWSGVGVVVERSVVTVVVSWFGGFGDG